MRKLWIVLLMMALTLSAPLSLSAQSPDSDGDGVPDNADLCYQVPGTAEFYGCTAETLPDLDGDLVPDALDTCIAETGLADNFGCPAGTTPDLDRDGVADSVDQCRYEFAQTPDGCPPDADGDLVPDFADGCPDAPGLQENAGCAINSSPIDSDGDTLPDIYDSCPDQAGAADLGGCLDGDGDSTPDLLDQCPDQAGEVALFGCSPMLTTTLPATLAPITPTNAAQIAEVARLMVGLPRMAVASDGTLAVRASDDLLIYDLNTPMLAPRATVNTGWSGYAVAAGIGAIATYELPADFAQLPYVQVRTSATGEAVARIDATAAPGGEALAISEMRFHPTLPLLALAQTPISGVSASIPAPILLWDVAANQALGSLTTPDGATHLAFSGDGVRLAGDYAENGLIQVGVWDVGTQTQIATVNTEIALHFMGTPMALNGDGTLLAVGDPNGVVSVWLLTPDGAQRLAALPLFDRAADELVTAITFSPDGALIAVAGGVPFSGGLTGEEIFPIRLIDVNGAAVIGTVGVHETLVRDLQFSADGRLLISVGDSSVRFWGVGG